MNRKRKPTGLPQYFLQKGFLLPVDFVDGCVETQEGQDSRFGFFGVDDDGH